MNFISKRKIEADPDPQVEAFKKQKPLPKDEVMKLKPGTFIELKWTDAPNSVALLLEKPDRRPGDVSLQVLTQELEVTYHPIHSQVVAVKGTMAWPKASWDLA